MEQNSSEDLIEIAISLFTNSQKGAAVKLLKDFISTMPSDWKPINELENCKNIAFWDMDEFLSFVLHYKAHESEDSKNINWVKPSHSKAFYYLAYMAIEEQDFPSALNWIEQALRLEPDHPLLLSEKAMIVYKMNDLEQAYRLYMDAAQARPWATHSQQAKALRGVGCVLIDMNKLDDAETVLKLSLEVEPNNKNAIEELIYIHHLRGGGQVMESIVKKSESSTFLSTLNRLFGSL